MDSHFAPRPVQKVQHAHAELYRIPVCCERATGVELLVALTVCPPGFEMHVPVLIKPNPIRCSSAG